MVRETAVSERGRPIIIELHPSHLVLRLKGLRDSYFVAYDALLWRVMKVAAERIVSERLGETEGATPMNRLHIGRQKLARFLFRGGRARRAPGSPARPPSFKRRRKPAHREESK